MKKQLFALTLSGFVFACSGEVFIGPTTSSNRFVIQTNEAIIVSLLIHNGSSELYPTVTLAGQTAVARMQENSDPGETIIIAGPGELSFTNRMLISFRRIRGANIYSILVTNAVVPVEIAIPADKTLKIAKPSIDVRAEFVKGSLSAEGTLFLEAEFSGPLTVRLRAIQPGIVSILSYYFTEDFLAVPDLGLLQGPTGSFEITIERSANLTDWRSIVMHPTSSDERAFYRLKISK